MPQPDIEHGLALEGVGNAIEAGLTVIGFVLDARHALIDLAILAVGDERDALAEMLDVVDQRRPSGGGTASASALKSRTMGGSASSSTARITLVVSLTHFEPPHRRSYC